MGEENHDKEPRQILTEQILKTVERLCKEDILLQQSVNERTIAHRFAIHLEEILGEGRWLDEYPHVDVEYNRVGNEDMPVPKRLDENVKNLLSDIENLIESDTHSDPEDRIDDILGKLQNRLIYPDIIAHERGAPRNLLVIELKKGTSTSLTAEDEFDHAKLMSYTDEQYPKLNYTYGVFLKFSVGGRSQSAEEAILDSAWFENGEKVENNPLSF